MLPLSLAALGLATTCAYAKPTVRAMGRLEVFLSTPTDKVASVSDVRIVATVNNVGEEDLKILKLGTVLDDDRHTRSFIVSKDGKEIPFTGITLTVPVDHLTKSDWVVIPAGESMIVEHDGVSGLYDFSASGPGTFTFDPVSTFQVIRINDNFETTSDTTRIKASNVHPVSIAVADDVSKRELNLEKRHQVSCGDNDKNSFISDSVGEAVAVATGAIIYMLIHGPDDQLYKDYFGTNNISSVIDNFNRIRNQQAFPGVMNCSDHCSGNTGLYYQLAGDHFDIYFCDSFHNLNHTDALCTPGTGVGVPYLRGSQVLRVLAYVLLPNVGTQEDECSQNMGLPNDKAIRNPNTYMCFASEIYRQGGCK